jgi:hypothetical protein
LLYSAELAQGESIRYTSRGDVLVTWSRRTKQSATLSQVSNLLSSPDGPPAKPYNVATRATKTLWLAVTQPS